MLPSSSPSPHPQQGSVASPDRTLSPRLENSTSPRRHQAQLTSRDPFPRSELNGALRMGDFYLLDASFSRLRDALKLETKPAALAAPPAILNELQNSIKFSALDAEKFFSRRAYAECRLFLDAAKSNQVRMLGKIDDIADADMPADMKAAIRSCCIDLGAALTTMMLRAQTQARAAAEETERKRKAQDSDEDSSPPGSPAVAEAPEESIRHTPARGSRKRAQDDTASPDFEETSPKRQKTQTTPSATNSMVSTASTANTASTSSTSSTSTVAANGMPPLPSTPTYKPAPSLQVGASPLSPGPGSLGMTTHTPQAGASTTKAAPKKSRALSPQPRPRPRSQLFIAPPDFTAQVLAEPTPRGSIAAPIALPAGVTTARVPETPKEDADNAGQRS